MTKSLKSVVWILLLSLFLWIISPMVPVFAEPNEEEATESVQQEDSEESEAAKKEETKKAPEKNDDGLELPELNSDIILLLDRDSGKVLYSRNADKKAEPASLTKILTVLMAVEAIEGGKVSEDDTIEAFDDCLNDLDEESSSVGLVPGERLSLKDLLYCAMLPSAGEACNIIAEYLSGSIEKFVGQMNGRAAELGCSNTHFVNPHGLPAKDHYSTANDIARITKEAMAHPMFAAICATPSYTLKATNKSEERILYNSNALLCSQGIYGGNFLYDRATGVKTGHTNAAGYCLSSTAETEDVHLMCVVMGGGTSLYDDYSTNFHNFSDAIHLYNWAFENYHYYSILNKDDLVSEITLKYAPSDDATVTLHPEKDLSVLVPSNVDPEAFEKTITYYDDSPAAPVDAGQPMGEISVSYGGVEYGKATLLTTNAVELSQTQLLRAQLKNIFGRPWVLILLFLLLLLAALYIAMVVNYRKKRQRQLAKKRQQARARMDEKTRQAKEQMSRAQRGKMREYDRNGQPKDPHAEKHEYFEEFFRDEEAHRRR